MDATRNEELEHYGVKGMKWGIRRARKQLSSAATSSDRDHAVSKLQKHREKASREISKLEKKQPGLQKAYDKAVTKTDMKIAKMERKSSRLAKRATRAFTSSEKTQQLLMKSQVLDLKVKELKAYSNTAKANLAKNERLQQMFREGIDEIDDMLVTNGRRYIQG